MDVINAMFVGAVAGLIVALPAIWSEIFRRGKNLPILVDVHACWGGKCHDGEVFTLSFFTHMMTAIGFGGFYMVFYLLGWGIYDFNLGTLLVYTIFFWLVISLVIFPLVGIGWFGKREGRWVWAESLMGYVLIAVVFWGILQLFPVFLP